MRKTLEQLIREGGVVQRNVLRAAIAELADLHGHHFATRERGADPVHPDAQAMHTLPLLMKRWRSYLHLRGPGDRP